MAIMALTIGKGDLRMSEKRTSFTVAGRGSEEKVRTTISSTFARGVSINPKNSARAAHTMTVRLLSIRYRSI